MRRTALTTALLAAFAVAIRGDLHPQGREPDWAPIDEAIGRAGTTQPGGVRRFSFPRSDMQVTVGDVKVRPALALGSWAAFLPTGKQFMVMGDLVLRDTEVDSVLAALQRNHIEQTAIHHHILRESPRVLYMHIHAHGDGVEIARGIRAALAQTSTPPASPASNAALDLDTTAVRAALGFAGRANGGVYQVSVARSHPVRSGGVTIPPSMGVATAINFQPTGQGRAAITGDFVLTGKEVNAVLKVLQQNGIEVTALHNHLLDEEPRLFFMHFWANDDAVKLARGLRAALELTKSARP